MVSISIPRQNFQIEHHKINISAINLIYVIYNEGAVRTIDYSATLLISLNLMKYFVSESG
jgi:hypothetical protein